MILGVPREVATDERRVAVTPETVKRFLKKKLEVVVESGAGAGSLFSDAAYVEAGARIDSSAESLYSAADLILKVREPSGHPELKKHEVELFREESTLVSLLYPVLNADLVRLLQSRRISAFAMDLMPRITRAQSMDCLSSMSSIAGYRAVILAALKLPKYFPMLMTAAGTILAARVFIVGAGVAGLQAIATARRLGSAVEAFDIRPVVKEQVESLGARFVELDGASAESQDAGGYAKEQTSDNQERTRQLLHDHVKKADVVITTALVPGKRAPVLITSKMVDAMRPGSVVVDLAAEMGGNCECTEPGQEILRNDVLILGPLNLPGEMAHQSSILYARNICAFVEHLVGEDGELTLDLEDELTAGPLVTRQGEVVHEATKTALNPTT